MEGNSHILTKEKQKEVFILILCLFIGFALRFYRFDQKSLWLDEVYTFEDSRDDFNGQLAFYAENPTFLHPPLFFVLTHLFYPFPKPERDLRIIPLVFGTLSILMIYLLAKQFFPPIALPSTLSLTFMTYHISLSQDGRSYSLLMFMGITGLYFFMKHLHTSRKRYLLPVALCFALLLLTSYSSIPFIVFSQVLWFYRPTQEAKKPALSSFFVLNCLILLFCLPWIIFAAINFKGQSFMDFPYSGPPFSLWHILNGVLHDWLPHTPLAIASVILLILLPVFSKSRGNAFALLSVWIFPIGGLYAFCKLLDINHFVTSRYFINFLPLFLVTLYISLATLEIRFDWLKSFLRLKYLFVILFILSNLIILPLYYHSEKQDFKGLVTYLKTHLRKGDKIFCAKSEYFPAILHYFKLHPQYRHHIIQYRKTLTETEYQISFIYKGEEFTIYNSEMCSRKYVADGNRLWVIVGKLNAINIRKNTVWAFMGYFDGSFLNYSRFPTDASMYLFLWDPRSPNEKGIDVPIE
jgi:uncharacterized membrane protein